MPGSAGFVTQTLSPGQTAGWTFVATAGSPGTYTAHFTAQGTFATSGGVSNTLDMTIPVAQGTATGEVAVGAARPPALPTFSSRARRATGRPRSGPPSRTSSRSTPPA